MYIKTLTYIHLSITIMNSVQIFTTLLILVIVFLGIYICIKFDLCRILTDAGRYQNNNIQHILPQHIRNVNANVNNSTHHAFNLAVPPKYEDVVRDENNINQEIDYDNDHRIITSISNPPGYGSIV